MIAVVQIGGHQAIVKEGEKLEVDKLDIEVGKTAEFDTLLISNEDGSDFQMGEPFLKGTKIKAKVIEHGKGDKVRVFKMKPRKRYRRTQGHRQDYTLIEIQKIGATPKAALKKETKSEEKKEDKTPKTTSKKETTAAKKDSK